jgi:DNA-binding transcriptional LysR family regulator
VQQQRPRDKCGSPGALIDDLYGSSPQLLVTYATDDYVTVQSLVAAGLGVTLLPELAGGHREIELREVEPDTPLRRVWAVTRERSSRSPATEEMLALLRDASQRYRSERQLRAAA